MLPGPNINAAFRVFALLALAGQSANAVEVPSGLKPELSEVLIDRVGQEVWARFRFLEPSVDRALADALAFERIEADFPFLCTHLAVPYLKKHELTADKVIISLSDRFVAFGTTDAEATQYFEQFRIADDDCIWEGF